MEWLCAVDIFVYSQGCSSILYVCNSCAICHKTSVQWYIFRKIYLDLWWHTCYDGWFLNIFFEIFLLCTICTMYTYTYYHRNVNIQYTNKRFFFPYHSPPIELISCSLNISIQFLLIWYSIYSMQQDRESFHPHIHTYKTYVKDDSIFNFSSYFLSFSCRLIKANSFFVYTFAYCKILKIQKFVVLLQSCRGNQKGIEYSCEALTSIMFTNTRLQLKDFSFSVYY